MNWKKNTGGKNEQTNRDPSNSDFFSSYGFSRSGAAAEENLAARVSIGGLSSY
jgi:hypothetical protein